MALKISNTWKGRRRTSGSPPTVREYEQRFSAAEGGRSEDGTSDHKDVNNLYYDLVTDFFEYGWGRSFHFAPTGSRGELQGIACPP